MKVFLEVFAWLAEEAYNNLWAVGLGLIFLSFVLGLSKQPVAVLLAVVGSAMIIVSAFLPENPAKRNS